MGKKLSPEASQKLSKNEKKQEVINSWLKVLRPKVYITDTSSFKKLVQELTGNGTTTTTISTTPPTEEVTTTQYHGESDESSLETSLDSFHQYGNHLVSFPEEPNQSYGYQVSYLDDTTTSHDGGYLWMNHHQQRDGLESLLPDIDGYPPHGGCSYGGCLSQVYQLEEVSIYDYELSGVL